ncbi:nucleoside monophosphate kinase [Candidatus Parcubacteria bacterium]|nr:nucleoside monophosphate kinase [Candidatus Parcubacteria bacterium]
MKKNINIIIMGPQGSGKGTQARFLTKKYDLQIFETGAILRELAKQDSEIGRKINEIINVKGDIVPWDFMKERILGQKLDQLDRDKGVIFDGTPRIIEEVEFWSRKLKEVERKIDYIFYIDVSKDESVRRISSRKLCRENSHPLIVGKDLSEDETMCPICGSEVYRREDDTPKKALNRLKWNEENMKPVVEYYDQQKMITRIDGERSIEEINEEILSYIQ